MLTPKLTEDRKEFLEQQRQRMDQPADDLAASILGNDEQRSDTGRNGYNHLIDVADLLMESPQLQNAPGSNVEESLKALPQDEVNYFKPIPVPEWVEEDLLAHASQLWDRYMVMILGVLYARSLPACYLIAKGIPALYQSKKLAKIEYIYQRIYETGLMLDSVMSPGGLDIMHDLDHSLEEHLEEALKETHPDATFTRNGNRVSLAEGQQIDHAKVASALKRKRENVKPKRYLSGPGYISAKKIRLLHASMRYMLQNPDKVSPKGDSDAPQTLADALSHRTDPWDTKQYGAPVNQEDLAYTLLTFGVDIPNGLSKWGVKLSPIDKKAFLHTWRLVGHIIGIEDALLPKSWGEAKKLYAQIAQDQASPSKDGREMTEVLMQFLEGYMPEVPTGKSLIPSVKRLATKKIILKMRSGLPAILIKDQLTPLTKQTLGWSDEKLGELFIDDDKLHRNKDADSLIIRSGYRAFKIVLWIYFRLSGIVFSICPPLRDVLTGSLDRVSRELIESWRGVYNRRPFYIPDGSDSWQVRKGVDEDFLKEQQAWRQKMFNTVAIGIGAWMCTIFVGTITLVMWLAGSSAASEALWATIFLSVLAYFCLNIRIERVTSKRPQLPSQTP